MMTCSDTVDEINNAKKLIMHVATKTNDNNNKGQLKKTQTHSILLPVHSFRREPIFRRRQSFPSFSRTLLPFYLTIQSFPTESRHLDVRVDFYIVYYFFLTNILNLEGYLEDTRIKIHITKDPLLWPTTR